MYYLRIDTKEKEIRESCWDKEQLIGLTISNCDVKEAQQIQVYKTIRYRHVGEFIFNKEYKADSLTEVIEDAYKLNKSI